MNIQSLRGYAYNVASLFDRHIRPAGGNDRTRLGIRFELGSALKAYTYCLALS